MHRQAIDFLKRNYGKMSKTKRSPQGITAPRGMDEKIYNLFNLSSI